MPPVSHMRHREMKKIEKERRPCCCCGASNWTKFFAAVQIIIYLLQLVAVALLYTGVLGKTGHRPRSPDEEWGAIALVIIGAFFSVFGIIAAVIFIKGAHQSNSKYLTVAMVCATLCYTWKLVEFGLEVGVSGGNIFITLIGIGVITIVYIFTFWASFALKREIRQGSWIGGVYLPRLENPHVIVIPPAQSHRHSYRHR